MAKKRQTFFNGIREIPFPTGKEIFAFRMSLNRSQLEFAPLMGYSQGASILRKEQGIGINPQDAIIFETLQKEPPPPLEKQTPYLQVHNQKGKRKSRVKKTEK